MRKDGVLETKVTMTMIDEVDNMEEFRIVNERCMGRAAACLSLVGLCAVSRSWMVRRPDTPFFQISQRVNLSQMVGLLHEA